MRTFIDVTADNITMGMDPKGCISAFFRHNECWLTKEWPHRTKVVIYRVSVDGVPFRAGTLHPEEKIVTLQPASERAAVEVSGVA